MTIEVIDKFGGLYTAADDFSTPGSPSMNGWDIDLNDNLQKTKGYSRVTGLASGTTDTYVTVTSMTLANPCVLTVSGTASNFFGASSTVLLYDFNDTTFSGVIGNYMWNVSAVDATTVTLEGCNASGLTGTSKTAKIDPSFHKVRGFCSSGVGVSLDNIESQGAFYDSTEDIVYSFLANKTETKSYLTYTDKDTTNWQYSEGSSVGSTTIFGTTHKAWFDQYGSNIILTKGETQGNTGSLVSSGGLFYIQASGQLKLYGETNNPTGKYVETHKDRIWVGNITALSGQAQNGESWVQVSKFIPEPEDTRASIVNSGIVFGVGTAQIILSGHSYKVGDEIYLSGIAFSGVQDDMNQRLHTIVGLDGSGIVIEYDNVNDLAWDTAASSGDVLLRGPTWGTSLTIYDDILVGAGIFRCDDNNDDEIVQLKSSFGALAILREQNPYIFTGAIESGSQTLARPLNVSYGTVSPFTFMTAGGVWFISQYGVSKIQGTKILTNRNELDNIVDISVVEPIRPTFEAIATKSGLIPFGIDRRLMIHDPDTNTTFIFDTLKGTWYRWYNRLADRFVTVGEEVYSIYKNLLFKIEDGSQTFSLTKYMEENISSSYFTKIYSMSSIVNTKTLNMLFGLIEGAATTSTTNPITVNVFYNGSASAGFSFSWDIKTGDIVTWNSLTTNGTLSWDTVTTNGTVTWNSLLGDLVAMLENRKYRLGSARTVQFEIAHSDNSAPRISTIFLDYEVFDVDLQQ